MSNFIYVFLVCILLIGVIVAMAVLFSNASQDNDSSFRDQDGRHSYYDRSLIEKEEFHRDNPEVPYSEIRSFKRLFRNLRGVHKK